MGAAAKTSRRRANPGFLSWRPMIMLACAVVLVRIVVTTGLLDDASDMAAAWTPGESLSEFLLRAAGLPGDEARTPLYLSVLMGQSALLQPGGTAQASPDVIEPGDAAPETQPQPQDTAPPDVSLAPVLNDHYPWGVNASAVQAANPQPVTETGLPGDDRVWPEPDPSNPSAKPIQEVTLLAPKDSPLAVSIINDPSYSVDIPAMLASASKLRAAVTAGAQILIIHTHGSESFLPDDRHYYVPTDIERTEDTHYNVVRLGDEMTHRLQALGLTVIHDRTIYDYPTYRNSYSKALTAIEKHVADNPSLQMVIDIHRDSIQTSNGTMYKAVSETDRGKAAQMMFVIGSNATGLVHDHWRDNLTLACLLEQRLLSAYPTLMRPIHLRKERFNQHATTGSMILEVGTAANSLSEALLSVNLFCDTVGPVLAESMGVAK